MSAGEAPGVTRTEAGVDHQKAASLLRATLESTSEGLLVIDRQGTIQTYNRRFAEMWGMPENLLAVSAQEQRLQRVFELVKDPEYVRRRIQEMKESPDIETFDSIELKDGRVFERRSRPQVLDGEIIGRVWSLRDVTEARRAEEQLRESEERFRLIAENVGDLVAMLAPDGRRLYNSPSYRQLFDAGDIRIGSDSFREIHPEDRERIKEIFRETVETGVGQSTEFRFILKDGSISYIESEGRVIQDAQGKVSKVVVVSRDITERKRAEQRQQMEHAVTRVLADAQTLSDAMPRIIQTVCETLAWDCGARWSMDESARAVRCAETWSRGGEPLARFVEHMKAMSLTPSNVGLVRQVWLTGQPKWIADVSRDRAFMRAAQASTAGLHGAFAFPILAGSVTLGVLEFFSSDIRQPDGPLLQMVRVIGSQIGQFMARKQAEENLLYVATHDTLTGLPNRYMFQQRFAHALTHAQRYGRQMALLFLDLDRFKYVNDTLGHPFGDRLLVEVAARLRGSLRDSDTVVRFGGDEFVALLEELASPNDVAAVAQKVLDVVRKPYVIDGETCEVTASVGVSLYPGDGEDLDTLLKNADIAIYRAKDGGRDTYVFHSADMNAHLVKRIALEGSLRAGLDREEFVLHYQPKAEVGTGRITGLEALVRWRHPELGLIPPAQFIALAEQSGLIVPLGNWVLRTACEQAKQFQNGHRLPVSVNLSARQFEDPHLVRSIERALGDTGLAPQLLEFEVTETMVMRDPHNAARTLSDIKAMGIRLSLDDFGTGYSSLASIKRFPFDCIKIDRSFINDIPGSQDDAALTRAIIAMAHGLRLSVVAEGVETREQLGFLHELGCHEFQGFLFRRPEPPEQLAPLLSSDSRTASWASGEAPFAPSGEQGEVQGQRSLFRA